jgi:hypothetical protein
MLSSVLPAKAEVEDKAKPAARPRLRSDFFNMRHSSRSVKDKATALDKSK